MNDVLLSLLAQAPAARGNPLMGFLPIAVLLGVFWIMFIVPQRRQMKQHQEMVSSLQKGDQVVTAGGLIGEIVSVRDAEATLRTGSATVVVERAKIARKTTAPAAADEKK